MVGGAPPVSELWLLFACLQKWPKFPFGPLVFSSSGGMGPTASIVYRRLANLISSKHSNPYSRTILFIRCKLSFALLRSSLRCLRGSRSNSTSAVPSDINIDLPLSEGKVSYLISHNCYYVITYLFILLHFVFLFLLIALLLLHTI